jgi:short-subunit dehydrogenase
MKTDHFHNKVVIITGSAQGIGKRTAEMLAKRGAKVVINSRKQEKVTSVVETINNGGGNAIGLSGDVSSYEFCCELRDFTLSHFSRIDYLINNAALASKGGILDTEPHLFEEVYKVNIFGGLNAAKAVVDELIKTKGGILFISSLAGVIGLPSYFLYSSTKSAVATIAESLSNELYDKGVFVGVHIPGFTENDPDKNIILPNGEIVILPKRTNVKVLSRDTTVKRIILQLEKRKFKSYSSFSGYFLEYLYRLSPPLSLLFIRMNRQRIMISDTFAAHPIYQRKKRKK